MCHELSTSNIDRMITQVRLEPPHIIIFLSNQSVFCGASSVFDLDCTVGNAPY